MKRHIELYIGGRLADLSDESFILFNYTFEEVGSPVTIKNSKTYPITLPGTPANNAIFDEFYRLDGIVGTGFNPLVRTPFKIFDETGEMLVTGYCKLDRVQSTGETIHSYSVTLYGSLGGYFYDLMYNEDGTSKNLGDIQYRDANGQAFTPNTTAFDLYAQTISDCWSSLHDGSVRSGAAFYNVLNFAPCYNGLPTDFDTKKALVQSGMYKGLFPSGSGDDRPHPDSNGTYLVTMATDKTEDEVRDYRAYLQRPVLSVSAFLSAMVERGGLTITPAALARMDDDIWITLPLPARRASYGSYPMSGIFSGTMTPADLLISLAKSFALVFDTQGEQVTMMTRDEFFADGIAVDIESRLTNERGTTPVAIESKWYLFKDEIAGEFADEYAKVWNKCYGEQKVNTGYEFDAGSKTITDLKTRGAVQFLESSQMFVTSSNATGLYFPSVLFEDTTFVGYNQAGTESKTITLDPYLANLTTRDYFNDTFPGYDVFDKPQMYSAGKKAADGSGVLLWYLGRIEMPDTTSRNWHLSNDANALFGLLNDGKPCWDMRHSVYQTTNVILDYMPHFSRWSDDYSLDWGIPQEIAVPGVNAPQRTLYTEYWRDWIAALYDKDTKVVTRKVNLEGLQVGTGLMKNSYWFGGQRWRLNKIVNHSMTTFDLTECEFVRITEVEPYSPEPTPDTPTLTLAFPSASISADAQTAKLNIKSTIKGWRLKSKPEWITAVSPSSGDPAETFTEVSYTAQANGQTLRTGKIVFVITDDESIKKEFTITQQAQVIPSKYINAVPNPVVFTSYGQAVTIEVSANVAWSVNSTPEWIGKSQSGNRITLYNGADTPTEGILQLRSTEGDGTICNVVCKYATSNYFSMSPSGTIQVSADTTEQEITITSDRSWRLNAGTGVQIDGASYATGTGNKTLTMTFAENTGSSEKHNTLSGTTTSGSTITASLNVKQAGTAPTPSEESISTNTASLYLKNTGETGEVIVDATSGWTIYSKPNWITADPTSGNAGQTGVALTASATATEREGDVVFRLTADTTKTASVHISQGGEYLNVTPTEIEMMRYQTNNIAVDTNATSWDIDHEGSYNGYTITKGANGFSVTRNDEVVEPITIEVSTSGGLTQDVTINLAEGYVLRPFPTGLGFIANGESKTIQITANVAWEVDTLSLPEWLSVSPASGTGTGNIVVTAELNGGVSQRDATIAVTGDHDTECTIPVTQQAGQGVVTIAWVQDSPISVIEGLTAVLSVETNQDAWNLSQTGDIDGDWYVERQGNTVLVTKTSSEDVSLTLRASTTQGVHADMVLNSVEVVPFVFTGNAQRSSLYDAITGGWTLVSNDSVSHSVPSMMVKFLNAYGSTLSTKQIIVPGGTIAARGTLTGTETWARATEVSRYNLQNATKMRLTISIDDMEKTIEFNITLNQ